MQYGYIRVSAKKQNINRQWMHWQSIRLQREHSPIWKNFLQRDGALIGYRCFADKSEMILCFGEECVAMAKINLPLGIVIETKRSLVEDRMMKDCEEAIEQIGNRQYAKNLQMKDCQRLLDRDLCPFRFAKKKHVC